jgi:hypothetical protein
MKSLDRPLATPVLSEHAILASQQRRTHESDPPGARSNRMDEVVKTGVAGLRTDICLRHSGGKLRS